MAGSPHSKLRAEQQRIVFEYTHGRMGIAAVPGSGKTFTLAHLAAYLIYDRRLGPEQEVLVVTFTNTAVNSFQARIARILQDEYRLLPFVGYRVRTLHGLAHDIVRERPALVGLADDFVILDEKLSLEIQRSIVAQRISEWRDRLALYLIEGENRARLQRQFEQDLPELVTSFIKRAKDLRCGPDQLLATLYRAGSEFDLARFAVQVYADYQRSLAYRGAVDFDDLVWLALEALDRDPAYLQRLQLRWPYVLEDEAQDSSRLQEQMLRLLSGNRNWVRVGDPNQAINTTFTTADPSHLLHFLDRKINPGVVERSLSVSGRSAVPIIRLANELVRWTVQEHPVPELRSTFEFKDDRRRGVRRGVIEPVAKGDPQANPPESSCEIQVVYHPEQRIDPDKELELIVAAEDFALVPWLQEWQQVPEAERPTVAVLVPQNRRGFKVAELLRRYGIVYEELLRSTTATRRAVKLLETVLDYLANPADFKALKQLFWELLSAEQRSLVYEEPEIREALAKVFNNRRTEDFLWPVAGWGSVGVKLEDPPWLRETVEAFPHLVRRWLKAASLPVDQLILTIGQDLFSSPPDMALAYKVAVLLRGVSEAHSDWRLPQFAEELRVISNNERRFIGFDDAEAGYEPKPGVVTVATMHAAKGLEWDRVYLVSVNNYDFPSAAVYDPYIGEKWYLRDSLNLEAELVAQLEALVAEDVLRYSEGQATRQARLDYAAERLRLLYVGITRARRQLVITWNMGHFWNDNNRAAQVALPLVMLSDFVPRVWSR